MKCIKRSSFGEGKCHNFSSVFSGTLTQKLSLGPKLSKSVSQLCQMQALPSLTLILKGGQKPSLETAVAGA